MKFSCFSPFVRLNKIGRCFKQTLHRAVMTTTPLHRKTDTLRSGVPSSSQTWMQFMKIKEWSEKRLIYSVIQPSNVSSDISVWRSVAETSPRSNKYRFLTLQHPLVELYRKKSEVRFFVLEKHNYEICIMRLGISKYEEKKKVAFGGSFFRFCICIRHISKNIGYQTASIKEQCNCFSRY